MVGVSITDAPVEEIELHVTEKAFGYIVTKPLHASQCAHPVYLSDGRWSITLKAQVNYELLSLLRSFGDGIEVMHPLTLRERMKDTIRKMAHLYEDTDD